MIASDPQWIRDDLAVKFEFDPARRSFDAFWDPSPPKHLSPQELRKYQVARNEFINIVGAQTGLKIAVIG